MAFYTRTGPVYTPAAAWTSTTSVTLRNRGAIHWHFPLVDFYYSQGRRSASQRKSKVINVSTRTMVEVRIPMGRSISDGHKIGANVRGLYRGAAPIGAHIVDSLTSEMAEPTHI